MQLNPVLRELFDSSPAAALNPQQLAGWRQQYPWYETATLAAALHAAAHEQADSAPLYAQAALITGNEPWLDILLKKARQGDVLCVNITENTVPVQESAIIAETTTEPVPVNIEPVSNTLEPVSASTLPEVETIDINSATPVDSQAGSFEEVPASDVLPVVNHEPSDIQEVIETQTEGALGIETINNQSISDLHLAVSVSESSSQAEVINHQSINNSALETTRPETPFQSEDANNQSINNQESIILLEPYHTIDYFASQGIRHITDEEPKDRLSKQLKSFTGWLKTMKKGPKSAEAETALTELENEKVERMAQQSVVDNRIVTETMAEVLVKQGRVGEAIGIYEKLSLQDNAKSAYFAARIADLKQ